MNCPNNDRQLTHYIRALQAAEKSGDAKAIDEARIPVLAREHDLDMHTDDCPKGCPFALLSR